MKTLNKIIISGGGTGGHIYPALSIAHEVKRRFPEVQILFTGAKGRMEMEKVPAAGFEIEPLWISGMQRSMDPANLLLPFKVLSSYTRARSIIRMFKPDVVVGTGGFASGPTLLAAAYMGIPTLIQEQNSYPGITNKLLARRAKRICVAYENLERFFPAEKIVFTGNPVRSDLIHLPAKDEARSKFQFTGERKVLLVLGGSLGARSINEVIEKNLDFLKALPLDILWQTGKLYYERYKQHQDDGVRVLPYIEDMASAYSAAGIIISRAGAGTISELALVGKPVLFIPSPNVAEDHQRKNAESVVGHDAALMLTEDRLDEFQEKIGTLVEDDGLAKRLGDNIKKRALPEATKHIVDEIVNLIK